MTQPAHQMKTVDAENQNLKKILAKICLYWPDMHKNGQKTAKMA